MDDVFVESSAPTLRLSDLRRQLHQRVMRFQPDLILVSLGIPDASILANRLRDWESNLFEIAETARQADAVLLINAPPRLAELDRDLLVRIQEWVDTLRSACAEWDALLIDQWESGIVQSARGATMTHHQMTRVALHHIRDWLKG